jgi:hypothetical protein
MTALCISNSNSFAMEGPEKSEAPIFRWISGDTRHPATR